MSALSHPLPPHPRAYGVVANTDSLTFTGELDAAALHHCDEHVDGMVPAHEPVVDLAGVTFFDVAGLRLLLRLDGAARGGIRLRLPPPCVRLVLELCDLGGRFRTASAA
ncbi:hypothetical protein DNL40_09565 [Xylanimonas oleitrophica]|uniref:STAS domain-containing protein n=1 Tax=Xylanimonas oleitrophica TaxID=2607479 RepID=A0A2W5XSN1_9MICO|nr:STAS domain-containing protein [Xylanimonas oleitrophica]PZR52898.1 hypothetical protein DNL40_09565 [Xylanimonas oleitrophica]